MKTKTIVACVLIVLGIVGLAYSGISFTTPEEPIDFLGTHIKTSGSHFISPTVGAIGLVGGIVILSSKRRSA